MLFITEALEYDVHSEQEIVICTLLKYLKRVQLRNTSKVQLHNFNFDFLFKNSCLRKYQ